MEDFEEWSAEAKDVLSQTLQIQENIQVRLTNLETHSCTNNVHIHGIPEGAERDNMHE